MLSAARKLRNAAWDAEASLAWTSRPQILPMGISSIDIPDAAQLGIAKAKAEGRYKGRKPTARAKTAEIKRLHFEGLGPVKIAEAVDISRISVWRVLSGEAAE